MDFVFRFFEWVKMNPDVALFTVLLTVFGICLAFL